MFTSPWPSGTSSPHWPGDRRPPGVLDVDGADVRAQDLDGPDRVAHVVEQHVGRVEIDLDVGRLQLVERPAEQVGGLLAGLEGQGHPSSAGELAGLRQGVEHRRAVGIVGLGQEAGVEHQVGQAQRQGAVEGPLQPLEPLARARPGLPKPPVSLIVCGVV